MGREGADEHEQHGKGAHARAQHAVVHHLEEQVELVRDRLDQGREPHGPPRDPQALAAAAVLERDVLEPLREVAQEVGVRLRDVLREVVHAPADEEEAPRLRDVEALAAEDDVDLAVDRRDVDPLVVVAVELRRELLELELVLLGAELGAEAHEPVARRRPGDALGLLLEGLVAERVAAATGAPASATATKLELLAYK